MSTNCNECRSLLERKVSFNLTDEEQLLLDSYLAECESCRVYQQELEGMVAAASATSTPELPDEYWDSYFARLTDRIASEDREKNAPQRSAQIFRMIPRTQRILQYAAVAAVLVIGILIGKVLFDNDSGSNIPQVAGTTEDGGTVQLASLDQRTDRFLDRSKVLLLGMVNMDLDTADEGTVDLSRTRLVANELVKESGPLRDELADADRQRLIKLLDDLEVILLQIANLEENSDIPAIEMVRDGVDQRAVLLKINVSEMRSQQRGEGI